MFLLQEDNPMDGPNIVMAMFHCVADDVDELSFQVSLPFGFFRD
jgi:hypothetical protein